MARNARLHLFVTFSILAAGLARADYEVVKATHGNLIISGYAIGRYTYQFGDEDAGGAASTSTFSARSADLIFRGDVFEYAGYFICVDAAYSDPLLDTYGTLNVIPHTEVRVGQFLVPFSRESYTSTSELLFIDRSLASVNVAPPLGRDVGAQLEYEFRPEGSTRWVTLAVAGINGSGPNRADENTAKDLAVRVAANPLPWESTKGFSAEGYYYRASPRSTPRRTRSSCGDRATAPATAAASPSTASAFRCKRSGSAAARRTSGPTAPRTRTPKRVTTYRVVTNTRCLSPGLKPSSRAAAGNPTTTTPAARVTRRTPSPAA